MSMMEELARRVAEMGAPPPWKLGPFRPELFVPWRKMDAEISRALPPSGEMCFCTGACREDNRAYQGACVGVPHYTQRWEDALSLVPGGYHPSVILRQAIDDCIIAVGQDREAFVARLPAFISATALRARAQQDATPERGG